MENKGAGALKGLISFIFTILIIGIVGFVAWFCVDFFGIVELPKEFSIVELISKYDTYVYECSANVESKEEISVQPRKRKININNNIVDSGGSLDEVISQMDSSNNNRRDDNQNPNPINSTEFYYSQLNEYSKYIYDEIYKNYENLKSGTYRIEFGGHFNDLLHKENGDNILNDSFQLALNSLVFDKPELYFINITKMFLYTEKTSFAGIVRYKHSIGPASDDNYLSDSFNNEEDTLNGIESVDRIVDNVLSGINNQDNEVDKIRQVHDFLIEQCQYSTSKDNKNIYNAYGAINDRAAVCEGYAKAFKLFLDKMNIESIIACGTGTNSSGQVESHAWNYVLVDGIWYAIDVTWDDPIILGVGTASYASTHKYFLVGSDKISRDHVENGELISNLNEQFLFKYPKLSINDYRE